MDDDAAEARSSTMRRDVVSAYVATAARVGSWFVVAAIVMRRFGADEFALLALVRGTLSFLNYGTLGLGPAMIHHLSRRAAPSSPQPAPVPVLPVNGGGGAVAGPAPSTTLAYVNVAELSDPMREVLRPLRETYAAGLRIALVAGLVGTFVVFAYAFNFNSVHRVSGRMTSEIGTFVLMMGLGAVLRFVSEAPAAALQVRGLISRDNVYQAVAEGMWVFSIVVLDFWPRMSDIGMWFFWSSAYLLVARLATAATVTQCFVFDIPRPPPGLSRALLADGGVIVLGQLANYLYAPAAMILINRLIDPEPVAYYEAAVQIDAALLLLVSSLAAVVLPKAAVAHAANDRAAVRRYYLHGTLGSLIMLLVGAWVVYVLSPTIFPLWLGNEMRTTQAILPILLISTVVGGSGMVGRSILLGMGKAKPFTIAALVAGVGNVALGFFFVKYLGLGLRGIVFATMIVVIARAGIWLPWYVMRSLRRDTQHDPQ